MTDGEKATKVLNYLEELDSTTIVNLLNPFLTDELLAMLYDDFKQDGLL